jgi:hypothetical protein
LIRIVGGKQEHFPKTHALPPYTEEHSNIINFHINSSNCIASKSFRKKINKPEENVQPLNSLVAIVVVVNVVVVDRVVELSVVSKSPEPNSTSFWSFRENVSLFARL